MIRVLVAMGGTLTRTAMAALLNQSADIAVVAEAANGAELLDTLRDGPDVIVLQAELAGGDWQSLCSEIYRIHPSGHVLVLADAKTSASAGRGLVTWAPRVGFVADETHPDRLVEAIRRMASGGTFLDSEIAVAALAGEDSPFTLRELEVLQLAARGAPVADIADRLCLAQGTVRNHLSRIIAKTGARTRIEAIRVAQNAGWI